LILSPFFKTIVSAKTGVKRKDIKINTKIGLIATRPDQIKIFPAKNTSGNLKHITKAFFTL
jgi:hypothetical protein